MVTLPIHPEAKITFPKGNATQVSLNNLKDVIEFINQVSNEVNDEVSDQVNDEVSDQVKQILKDQISEHVVTILKALLNQALSSKDILSLVGLNKHTDNKKRHIEPLLKYNWITYTIPNNPRDRNQKYQLTGQGKRLVKLLNAN